MFFDYRVTIFHEFFMFPVVNIIMMTWVYMCANVHFSCVVAYYASLVFMTVYFMDKCLDSYFNAELMRKDRIIGNFDPECTICKKELCEDLFFLQYVHGSCTPFNCPVRDDAPEVCVLKNKKKKTSKPEYITIDYTAKHRYCDDCLPEYIKFQSGNRQALCKVCKAPLDPSAVPQRNRYWFRKFLVFALQAASFVILYVDKVYEKGYFTNA